MNIPELNNSGVGIQIPPNVQYSIGVDGINTKILPVGSTPRVVYRIGDGTVHQYGWENIEGNKYLDFYISGSSLADIEGIEDLITHLTDFEDYNLASQQKAWEAEAEAKTALSYAVEPEDVFVKTYTSNNDGTFTATDTADYSALHYASKVGLASDPTFDSIQLSGGTGDQGTITWNADEETLDLIQNGATLQLGQEIQTHCRNNSGSTISNGTVCMVTGTLGASGRVTISPYDGTTDVKYIIGISTEDIADGTDGKVTSFGKVRGIDTSAYSEGSILYVTTDGGLTDVEPTNGIKNSIAFAVNSASNGTIMVRFTPIDEDQSIANLKADKTNVLELDNTTEFTPDSEYEPTTKKYVDDADTLKADKNNVLELDNTVSFAPTSDYHPSTKKYVDDEVTLLETSVNNSMIGVNQTWQDMSASRVAGITYTNETGKPIQLWLQWGINDNGGSRTVTHNSLSFTYSNGDSWEASFQMIIPDGGTYSVDASVDQWYELRE